MTHMQDSPHDMTGNSHSPVSLAHSPPGLLLLFSAEHPSPSSLCPSPGLQSAALGKGRRERECVRERESRVMF